MIQKRWLINKKYPKKFQEQFPEFSSVVLQLLWDRKIDNQALVDEFFNPDYQQDIHNPYLLKDMDRAVERIFQALSGDEKITVYGDYDVDGVTSSIVVVQTLIELKSIVSQIAKKNAKKFITVYIPDRELEGYGLNSKAIKKIEEEKTNLIITVDCGVSSFESVELINELGMEVIITDHHHVPCKIPNAVAVINSRQNDCKYPFKELAGVGIAFKLAQALLLELEKRNSKSEKLSATIYKLKTGFEKWLLDFVALGTVADCVDLVGENRTLLTYGLVVINKTQRIGIQKLVESAGTKMRVNGNVTENRSIDATSIGFMLAPRLNAAGRMDHANTSYELLISEDARVAEELAQKLEKNNQSRQRVTEKAMQEIKKRIDKKKNLPKIIIESDADWRIGIVGLVAGKLVNEYSRPFLILQVQEDKLAGSGRSIPEFNLIEAIEKCKNNLISFGGHSQAAGLKVESKNFKRLKKSLKQIADEILTEDDLIPSVSIDCEVRQDQIDWNLFDEIEKFKPFGQGNRKPVFMTKRLEVYEVRAIGRDNAHLKLCFKSTLAGDRIKYFKAIGFRQGKLAEEMYGGKNGLRWGDIVDVVFQLEVNQWNGNRELQMNVLDLKISE